MAVPAKYRKTGEGAIATYQYQDIADGTGVIVLDGYRIQTTGAVKAFSRRLSNQARFSNGRATTGTGGTGNPSTILDVDFDMLAFNSPRILDGKVAIMFAMATISSGGTGIEGYINLKVRKWDGTTETDIATTQLGGSGASYPQNLMFAHGSGASANKQFVLGEVTCPRTKFKIGENVRITIEIIKSGGTGTPTAEIVHDPTNRAYTFSIGTGSFDPATDYGTTRFIVQLPFRLDL